ncbi:MAG: DNA repair exonuclease [Desulforhabdus sp.]|jgi:DNA repair exonuclease SbcCD nuclease subunit|nr:DNA repair exonuclease [Desulforhabdus sp.]
MFKFIHAADIHLDSPLRGLARYEGAPVEKIRGATRQALKNLVDLAITEEVDFLLIAGDLYDGDWKDYNSGLFFAAQMTKLREAGIRVFIIAGNHDAGSQISRQLRMPDNVVRLSTKKPQTIVLDHPGVAIHGQGFARAAITEDLASAYPKAISGIFNIGMLHTSATGREGHETYAPCTLEKLLSKDYDYWALGHVHKREMLCDDPPIVFPGNVQGRHIRETGAKGCTLVTVGGGRVNLIEHRPLDVLRWSLQELDVTGMDSADEVVDAVGSTVKGQMDDSDGRLLALRLRIFGLCRAHSDLMLLTNRWVNEMRMAATDISGGNVWIEKIQIQTQSRSSLDEMRRRDDAVGGLLRSIQRLGADDAEFLSILDELQDFRRKLPPEMQYGDDAIDLHDPALRKEIIEDVKQLLLARLLAQHNSVR